MHSLSSRSFFAFIVLLCCPLLSSGQGTVRGTVSDEKGETLIGAAVVIKGRPATAVGTDYDGNYSITIRDSVPVVLEATFVGLQALETTVHPRKGEVLVVDMVLPSASVELKVFEVQHKARRSSDTYLERLKLNAPASIDFISRDQMVKTGDGEVSSAVKRVTGVSTIGSYVTVRGLADRYVVTCINGQRVPTLDPFTNNIKLDLFPTGLMDNVIITKTLTPDLPGDWSGAYLSMNTSDYPQKLRVSVSSTIGFNTNTTGKEIISAGTSSSDRLGFDDGTRGIPDGVPTDIATFPGFINPNLYQQLDALGLGAWMHDYGIVSTTPAFATSAMGTNSTLQHLALVELGLLPPALIHDANAVQTAVDVYNSSYNLAYFSPLLNSGLADLNSRFDNSRWRLTTTSASPNYNGSLTIGNQLDLFRTTREKRNREPMTLGFLVGARYLAETRYDGASTIERTSEPYDDDAPGDHFDRKGEQQVSQVSNGWNVLGNASLKFSRNHSISFTAMGNVLGQNNARYLVFLDPSVNGNTFVSEDQYWEQRKLWTLQFGSKHYFPGTRLSVTPDVSYSIGQRDILDLKIVQYVKPPEGHPISEVDGALIPPGRIYRFLDEELWDAKLGFELPMNDPSKLVQKLKFGGAYRDQRRTNKQAYFTVLDAPGPTQWEDPGRFDLGHDGTFGSLYTPFGTFKDNDIGILKVTAAYVMGDVEITPRVRLAGGMRAEQTDMLSDILKFWEEGLAADDNSRGTVGDIAIAGSAAPEPKPARPGRLDQWDLLPSLNLIYKLRPEDDEAAPVNLRLSYFRSLGRPSFRELSVTQNYDYILQGPVFGNPELQMTAIDNADIRLEYFFKNRDNISVSGFYKHFRDHIELLETAAHGFTWRNANRSRVFGVEIEGKVKLLKNLEWRGNVTFMDSRSYLTNLVLEGGEEYSTPMFGQAPYIVNSMLSYSLDSAGFTLSASYNVQGPKLAVTNSELDPKGIRAYEMPRHLVDITASQRIGRSWNATLRVRDLLSAPMRRSYQFASGHDVDFDRYTYGTDWQLTVSYTIR